MVAKAIIGHDALDAKDNDAAFACELWRIWIIDPIDRDARYLLQSPQGLRGQNPLFCLNHIEADALQQHQRLPKVAMPPTFSSPDDRIIPARWD